MKRTIFILLLIGLAFFLIINGWKRVVEDYQYQERARLESIAEKQADALNTQAEAIKIQAEVNRDLNQLQAEMFETQTTFYKLAICWGGLICLGLGALVVVIIRFKG